jgi:hypothetical protein
VSVPEETWDRIADEACGTAAMPATLAERHDVPEDDVEHELGLREVQACPACGWWSKTDDPDGYCSDHEDDDAPDV